MTDLQKKIYDEIRSTRTTGIAGPFGPWLANPNIAQPAQTLGRVCRYETSFDLMESELIILLTAKHIGSVTEWAIHVGEARKAKLDERIISRIAMGSPQGEGSDYALLRQALGPGTRLEAIYEVGGMVRTVCCIVSSVWLLPAPYMVFPLTLLSLW